MRISFLATLTFLFISLHSNAQLVIFGLEGTPNKSTKLSQRASNILDTIQLPFYEDFGTSQFLPNESHWLIEGGTFINNNYCVNPPTFNVATFDGLDFKGKAYKSPSFGSQSSTEIDGPTDYLISQAIDLSGVDKNDNLAMSFYWQKGGANQEMDPSPEKGDSIGLYFWASDSNWYKAWPRTDAEFEEITNAPFGTTFQYQFLPISSELYRHAGFQFKFETEGRQTGNFDVWSIDNVELFTGRVTTEGTGDVGFTTHPTSLLKNYHSMPLNQFRVDIANELSDEVTAEVIHCYQTSAGFANDSTVAIFAHWNDTTEILMDSSFSNYGTSGNPPLQALEPFTTTWETSSSLNLVSALQSISDTSEVLVLETRFAARMNATLKHNDVISSYHTLENYFAYDDGSPEVSAGLQNYGQLAVEFDLNVADSLTGIDIFFPKIEFNLAASEDIHMRVWSELQGVDGASTTTLEFGTFQNITYHDSINQSLDKDWFEFVHVVFESPIYLPEGKFFVGYEQNIGTRLPIGLDLSTNHMDKVWTRQNEDVNWKQDFSEKVQGSLMIRPRFGDVKLVDPVGISESKLLETVIFPNPSTGLIQLSSNADQVVVYDLSQNEVANFKAIQTGDNLNLSHLSKGMYLIHISDKEKAVTQKLIIE